MIVCFFLAREEKEGWWEFVFTDHTPSDDNVFRSFSRVGAVIFFIAAAIGLVVFIKQLIF